MGTFKDTIRNWFWTNNSQASNANARIPLIAGAVASGVAAGDPIGSDTLKNIMLKQGLLSTSNVGIAATMSGVDARVILLRTEDYAANTGDFEPIGVWILEGGKLRIFSYEYDYNSFSAVAPSTSMTPASSVSEALEDMDGKAATNAFVTAMGENATAAKYCADYESTAAPHLRWWLPSLGELGMIFAHSAEFLAAMEVIEAGWTTAATHEAAASSSLNTEDTIYNLNVDGSYLGVSVPDSPFVIIPVTTIEDDNY